MASLREMKTRLRNIRTTGQLAGAMRTVATAKYSRVNALRASGAPYSAVCREILGCGDIPAQNAVADGLFSGERPCLVVCAGNRGLCGGFNTVLLSQFRLCYAALSAPRVVTVGRMAEEYCLAASVAVSRAFAPGDLPGTAAAEELAAYLSEQYAAGEITSAVFIYQKFVNMLRQIPVCERLLPNLLTGRARNADDTGSAAPESDGLLYLPDRATVFDSMRSQALSGAVYEILLQNATGAQAATMMAMRSAYDNSLESSSQLETVINRRRQSDVTSGVIEISSVPDGHGS